jgi:hypothetical protein
MLGRTSVFLVHAGSQFLRLCADDEDYLLRLASVVELDSYAVFRFRRVAIVATRFLRSLRGWMSISTGIRSFAFRLRIIANDPH